MVKRRWERSLKVLEIEMGFWNDLEAENFDGVWEREDFGMKMKNEVSV